MAVSQESKKLSAPVILFLDFDENLPLPTGGAVRLNVSRSVALDGSVTGLLQTREGRQCRPDPAKGAFD
jgi:hypothetical protein